VPENTIYFLVDKVDTNLKKLPVAFIIYDIRAEFDNILANRKIGEAEYLI